ncbi:pyk [Symbiodinium microadriaticum]|nr:pyk [Symbiodinium microadriaticum]
MLTELSRVGASVFRLNFSHGTHEDHEKVIKIIHEINDQYNANKAILMDLQGPKIRINQIKGGAVEIEPGGSLTIAIDEREGNSESVSTTYKEIVNDVNAGDTILIDDGNIELKVKEIKNQEVHTEVIHGGTLKSRKGINLPQTRVSAPSLTEKDKKDLEFGLQFDPEWVALSFVRKAEDIQVLRDIINKSGKHTKIVAKIEKPEALDNIDEIIEATDAVMVARGDLGVEIAMQDVPIVQKLLVKKCKIVGKPVIIATQMMESMINNPRPTRAETNDVANAILDGADAVMLSAESASGDYPVLAVTAMSKVIHAVEEQAESIYNYDIEDENSTTRTNDLLVRSACHLSQYVNAKAIIGMTKRIDKTLDQIKELLVKEKFLNKGDVIVNTASMPAHWDGHTNMMKIDEV